MPRCAAVPVHVSIKHLHRLEALVRQHHAPQSLVPRARIILLVGAGVGVRETTWGLDLGGVTVRHWCKRWHTSAGEPFAERLCDVGEPEQTGQNSALVCEPPSASSRRFTHWTQATLAAAAVEEGIAESI